MRRAAAAALLAWLVIGCGSQSRPLPDVIPSAEESAGPEETGEPTPEPEAAPDDAFAFSPDPDKFPTTVEQALLLIDLVQPEPTAIGPDFVAEEPAESDPATWSTLDDACVQASGPLPDGVLASVSRYSRLPATGGGDGPARVRTVVTVHADEESAAAELTDTLEEALRCPDREPGQGESVTGLISLGNPAGSRGQVSADDQVYGTGEYRSDEFGGPYPYLSVISRSGPVTTAVSVNGTAAFDERAVSQASAQALVQMQTTVQAALE
ncbi:hypothetical protein [Streptomyces hainanensis]|uniref:hypothetical protein n=1 Tax=Streptomyces hainanensis TaxID=402648 RepID=UPI0014048C1E|nr:hypothetical protein [Streptomyces hainanensis]